MVRGQTLATPPGELTHKSEQGPSANLRGQAGAILGTNQQRNGERSKASFVPLHRNAPFSLPDEFPHVGARQCSRILPPRLMPYKLWAPLRD